jgi:hypothetical protein
MIVVRAPARRSLKGVAVGFTSGTLATSGITTARTTSFVLSNRMVTAPAGAM